MLSVRAYIIGITAVALMGGILTRITGQKQGSGKLIQVLCGIFLTLTILQPLASLTGNPLSWISSDYALRAEEISAQGNSLTQNTLRQVITENTEAYILSKANEMGLQITATVALSQDDMPIPISVHLKGTVSPLEKSRLTSIISKDLGIPKEEQTWSR